MDVALSSYPDKLFPPGRSTSGRLGEPMSPRRPTERTANRSRILHSCAQCAENRYVTGHQGSSVARGSSRIEGCGGDVPCCLINARAWCDLCMIFRYHMAFLRGLKVCIDHSDKRHRSCINGRFLIPTRFPRRLWSLDRDRVSSGTMTGAPRQGAPLRSRPYAVPVLRRRIFAEDPPTPAPPSRHAPLEKLVKTVTRRPARRSPNTWAFVVKDHLNR